MQNIITIIAVIITLIKEVYSFCILYVNFIHYLLNNLVRAILFTIIKTWKLSTRPSGGERLKI